MKLKDLGVETIKKEYPCKDCSSEEIESEFYCYRCCNILKKAQEKNKIIDYYDNLELPIEQLKPSIDEIAIKLLQSLHGMKWFSINDEEKESWLEIAEAIYNLKPGG